MSIMNFRNALAILLFAFVLPVHSAFSIESPPISTETVKPAAEVTYFVEISISRNLLTLYEKKSDAELAQIAEFPVGTALVGLKTYPLGLGRVTAIQLNPWWYPTPYSRQVFRGRGIELPSAVPPGHPLNYMGPFKISLSHKTWKGAIYRIHGNNNPKRVGRRVTGGCFVMDNPDGLALANRIKVGTEVNIVP